jgi:hypothetical protein
MMSECFGDLLSGCFVNGGWLVGSFVCLLATIASDQLIDWFNCWLMY